MSLVALFSDQNSIDRNRLTDEPEAILQAVRGMGIRRARYDGLHKTLVQHVLIATAINLVRIDAVLTQTPRGKTRRSHFMRLALHPALQDQSAA